MDVNRSVIFRIIAVLLVAFAVFISSATVAGARGYGGQGMPVGAMTRPIQSAGTQISPMVIAPQGGQLAHPPDPVMPYNAGQQLYPTSQVRSYGGGSGTFHPPDPIMLYANGMQQFPPDPIRTYGGSGMPVGGNTGIAGYQNTPAQSPGGMNKLTPEKVEAGSENVRRVNQDSSELVTGGQPTNPLQPVPQPYDASLLRGSNSNDRKGGRYLGQYP